VTAFLGISVWITLATVMPGLITMAAMYGAFAFVAPGSLPVFATELKGLGDAALLGIAVAIMVLTQAIGILLEELLIRKRSYGPEVEKLDIPEGIDPADQRKQAPVVKTYEEYRGLYLLLADMREGDDSQGHLQRVVAQFFLTNNTLISYAIGLLTVIAVTTVSDVSSAGPGIAYAVFLGLCLVVTYEVVRIRFRVMAKALWATRRRRVADRPKQASPEDTEEDS
jgi:hypothetical protein